VGSCCKPCATGQSSTGGSDIARNAGERRRDIPSAALSFMLPGRCCGRSFRWCRARCAAVRREWRSLPGLLSARADLAAVGSGARLPCRHCGLRPVLPRSAARAAGGALSVVSPYRRSPLPFPGFRGQRRSWGITLFRLLGGYPSLPSGISDSTRETRRLQCGGSAVAVRFQCSRRPVPIRYRTPEPSRPVGDALNALLRLLGHTEAKLGNIPSHGKGAGPWCGTDPLGLGELLAERSEERPPRVSVEAERSSVAVGGVAHQDNAAVAGCLYARPVLAAE